MQRGAFSQRYPVDRTCVKQRVKKVSALNRIMINHDVKRAVGPCAQASCQELHDLVVSPAPGYGYATHVSEQGE